MCLVMPEHGFASDNLSLPGTSHAHHLPHLHRHRGGGACVKIKDQSMAWHRTTSAEDDHIIILVEGGGEISPT